MRGESTIVTASPLLKGRKKMLWRCTCVTLIKRHIERDIESNVTLFCRTDYRLGGANVITTLYRGNDRYSGQAIRHLVTRMFNGKTRCGKAETYCNVECRERDRDGRHLFLSQKRRERVNNEPFLQPSASHISAFLLLRNAGKRCTRLADA